MHEICRLLILEDDNDDLEYLKTFLSKKCDLGLVIESAVTNDDFISKLANFKPDVILADYKLSGFNGMDAFRYLQKANADIPFILVTGTVTEEFAIECMKEGVDDFILKASMKKLPAAIGRVIEKKKAEKERNESRLELERLNREMSFFFEAIDKVFFSTDMLNNKPIQISAACEFIYGYSRRQFFENPDLWWEVVFPEDRPSVSEANKMLSFGHILNLQYRIVRSDREIRWIESRIIPTLDESGVLVRIDGIISDITDKKKAENMLFEKVNELNNFLYRTSHDLRGPLSSTLGLINMLKKELQDSSFRKYIEMMENTNKSMYEILDRLTDVASINFRELQREKLNLKELLFCVLDDIKAIPGYDDIDFRITIEEAADYYGDVVLMTSILKNLLNNSINFRKINSPSIVSIDIKKHKTFQLIEVKDNGVGIPNDLQGRVFDMFYRGHVESKGSGLGLYIVKSAVDKLGGRIELKSAPDAGTSFKLMLPIS